MAIEKRLTVPNGRTVLTFKRHHKYVKTFNVYLRDGRIAKVRAETFRREGEQYVFNKAGTSETQFFVDSEIAGISEADLPQVPRASPAQQRQASLSRQGQAAAYEQEQDRQNKSIADALLAKTEEQAIVQALAECGGNRTQAARKLGISRRGLTYKLKRFRQDNLLS